jgi:hypothetical protein
LISIRKNNYLEIIVIWVLKRSYFVICVLTNSPNFGEAYKLAIIKVGVEKMVADTIVPFSDSLKFIDMANNLYNCFKNRVIQYDQHRYYINKSRKLILLEIKDSCYKELFNKWVIYSKQFDKGTPKYFYENKVFLSVTKRIKSKIDSLAWNNGIPY